MREREAGNTRTAFQVGTKVFGSVETLFSCEKQEKKQRKGERERKRNGNDDGKRNTHRKVKNETHSNEEKKKKTDRQNKIRK